MGAAMNEPTIPTEAELGQLSYWGMVAFAARCARRVLPLFRHAWPDAPDEHLAAVIRVIELTERSAATTDPHYPSVRDAADRVTATATAATPPVAAAVARAAENAATAATAPAADYTAAAANTAAAAAHDATHGALQVLRAIRADFDTLLRVPGTGHDAWLPVPPKVFGPMWPDGAPPGWPAAVESAEQGLPAEEEIARLPRWARTALAARCARRVLPLFRYYWPGAPATETEAVNQAVEVAERAAATALNAPALSDTAIDPEDGREATVFARRAARCAARSAVAAASIDDVVAAVDAADAAAHHTRADIAGDIRRDFETVRALAGADGWTDETPVPQSVFGPLWPTGMTFRPYRLYPQPGRVLLHETETWVLVEPIGQGGFAEVWLARRDGTDELRAVKFCTHHFGRTLLVTHESKVIRHVQKHTLSGTGCHPNIVPLLDFDLTVENPWLMYEYVGGGRTLVDVIGELRAGAPGERIAETVRLMHAIAGAVGAFHRLAVPIVHRDLKPRNVLMAGDTPRITDFGIGGAAVTAAISDATRGPTLTVDVPTMLRAAGAPRHASPQQARGEPPDPRDDVYALGVMAYQMLTGNLGEAPGADAADELRDLSVPAVLVDLIVKSVSINPARRLPDAAALAEALAPLVPNRLENAAVALKRFASVPGVWSSRPAGDHEAKWERVGFGPREVVFAPDREYCLSVHDGVDDEDLAGLRDLAGVAPFTDLLIGECRALSPAGLAPLAGLTNLRSLHFVGSAPTPDALASVAGLVGLRELSLGRIPITDAGMRHVAALADLRTLSLTLDQVTDAGLAHLAALRTLRSLRASNCPRTTDAGLAHLAGLTELQVLHLYNAVRVTDAGLAHLAGLVRLQELHLPASRVAGPGLECLSRLPELHALSLSGCQALTDASLDSLAALPALRSLDLTFCTRLTDAGATALAKLTALELLIVKGGGIKPPASTTLKAALPRCRIAD